MRTITSFALIVFSLMVSAGAAHAAARKVLMEVCTSTTCSPCYNADVFYFQSWLPGYLNAQRVITVSHHVWWPAPGNDPMYLANSSTVQARMTYYNNIGGSGYVPRAYIDGLIDGSSVYTAWPGMIDSRLQTASPISIGLTGFRSGDTLSMTARVYAEAPINSSNWRVHWVLLEDSLSYPQNSPSGYVPFIHDAVNRAMYPDANGSPISISQGQTVEIQKSIALNSSWVARKCRVVVFIQDNTDRQIMNAEVAKVSDLGPSGLVAYFESFTDSSAGWRKAAGPGFLSVDNGVFAHTPPGLTVWCEYAYTRRTFGNATYEADVFVDSSVVNTSFVWRAPDTTQLTSSGGAYAARFNNSEISPGGFHHFVLEKFDPSGRTILLDIPNRFDGLNHLEVSDTGTMLQVRINGVSYGSINVGGLTQAQAGYVFLIGGDRGNSDYFDNVGVRSILTLTSPNGGEEWAAGSTHNITWASAFVDSVRIELTTNDGASWATVVSSTPAASGSYSWLLTSLPVSQCRIRVSSALNPTIADVSDNPFTITGLVAYYPFNSGANDESGNGNNGTVYGAMLATDRFGKPNSAYNFNGAGDYVDLPESSSLTSFNDKITIAGWVYLRSYPISGWATPLVNSGNQNDYFFGVLSDGRAYSHLYLSSGPGAMTGGDVIPLNQWVHIGMSYDGSNVDFYVNGGHDTTFNRSGTIGGTPQAENIAIGAYLYNASFTAFVDGKMDDIRIYNCALSVSEIDSLYHEGYTTNQYPVLSSWNIVSVPLTVADPRKTILFSTATSNAFTYFPGGYASRDTLQNGIGYWIKFPSAQNVEIAGTLRMQDTIEVRAGWNMIGSISDSVRTMTIQQIPPTIIASQFYGYNAGYAPDSVLLPSRGYWVKTAAPGFLVLSSASILNKGVLPTAFALDKAATITLSDLLNSKQILLVSSEQLDRNDLDYYELPPPPPAGTFDARFSTNRMLEAVEQGEERIIHITLSSAEYPLTISWDMKGQSLTASLMIGAGEVPMNGVGSVKVADSDASIAIKLGGQTSLPREFALSQNYPNPFNPSTTIKYDLPTDTRVSLKVFNILGQEVITLVNEEQKAGFKSIRWDANNFASGLYFYHLQAGGFAASKKLLLLK